jgi:hypothetical protein
MVIEEGVERKVEMLRAYWSQLTWGQIERVGRYAREQGGAEVVWVSGA